MIQVNISGIPAQADVIRYSPAHAGCSTSEFLRGNIYPPEPEEVEFNLYDRKGYPAPWLEEKLSDQRVHEDVEDQVIKSIQGD